MNLLELLVQRNNLFGDRLQDGFAKGWRQIPETIQYDIECLRDVKLEKRYRHRSSSRWTLTLARQTPRHWQWRGEQEWY